MTRIPAVRQLLIRLELALSDLEAVARYARRILKRRRAKGLTVAAITDGNEFGISSGSPGDGAAVTGSVDLHNGLTSSKTLSYGCNGIESAILWVVVINLAKTRITTYNNNRCIGGCGRFERGRCFENSADL